MYTLKKCTFVNCALFGCTAEHSSHGCSPCGARKQIFPAAQNVNLHTIYKNRALFSTCFGNYSCFIGCSPCGARKQIFPAAQNVNLHTIYKNRALFSTCFGNYSCFIAVVSTCLVPLSTVYTY